MNNSYALLGTSSTIRNAKTMVSKAIAIDSSVLIVGENGTGKTDVARFIHEQSTRSNHPFVVVMCATIQESHFAREIAQAQKGTLFFQDIDKLSPRLQFVFYKSIQNICVQPSSSEQTSEIRLMGSSTTDLENFVRRGFFREDVFLKFSGLTVYLPALRERRDDIPMLINHFVQKTNQTKSSRIASVSQDAMKVLLQHSWPGNLQELDSLLERVAILKNTGHIELCDLPPRLRSLVTNNIDSFYNQSPNTNRNLIVQAPAEEKNMFPPSEVPVDEPIEQNAIDQFVKKEIDLGNGIDFYRIVEAFENKLLQEALKRAQHNKNKAAQLLSMNRTTLVEKLRKRELFAHLCGDDVKSKYNSSFTVLDGLGSERKPFEGQGYMNVTTD